MIIEKVKEMIGEHLGTDASGYTAETTLEELGIDSLETVEIMMELEDEFGIEIEASDVGKTIGSLAEYIESKKA